MIFVGNDIILWIFLMAVMEFDSQQTAYFYITIYKLIYELYQYVVFNKVELIMNP